MDPIIIKESEVLDSNLSMLVPAYPLSKEKLDILRKNSWDFQSIGGHILAIFLAFVIRIVAIIGHSIYVATTSDDHTLKIEGISSVDCWIVGISLLLWIICSFVLPKCVTSERDKLIEECRQFYERKKQ